MTNEIIELLSIELLSIITLAFIFGMGCGIGIMLL